MIISEQELRICADLLGKGELIGLDNSEQDIEDIDYKTVSSDLLALNIVEETADAVRFTAYGARIISILTDPDMWLTIKNVQAGIERNIYICDLDYMCLTKDGNGNTEIMMLPVLNVLIGAYADAVGELNKNAALTEEEIEERWNEETAHLQITGSFRVGRNRNNFVLENDGRYELMRKIDDNGQFVDNENEDDGLRLNVNELNIEAQNTADGSLVRIKMDGAETYTSQTNADCVNTVTTWILDGMKNILEDK